MTDLSLRALFAHQSGRAYAITGSFDGVDLVNGGKHNAVDVGNFGMDDPILAPITGRAQGLWHFDGAMGIRYELGDGWVLELWHLNATLADGLAMVAGRADQGDWVDVDRGQICGRTGNSGARVRNPVTGVWGPMPAHTHIALFHNGVPVDAEPYLLGKPLGTSIGGSAMRFRGSKVNEIDGVPRYRLTTGANFRAAPTREGEALQGFPAGAEFLSAWVIEGEPIGTNELWFETRMYVAAAGLSVLGYFHSSVVEGPIAGATPGGAGITPDQLSQAQRLAFGAGRDRATAAYGLAGEAAAKAVVPE